MALKLKESQKCKKFLTLNFFLNFLIGCLRLLHFPLLKLNNKASERHY